ncbi:MAG: histidine kinase [Saprospiraceae bacterium]|nr:histidine kinase [Saprospiraceae bacterium]MDW8484827.1 histidine kinase [Saprospiraceae bacterium]
MKYWPTRSTGLQILFWGVFWVLVPIVLLGNWENPERIIVRSTVVLSGIVLVVWLNVEVLLPTLYFNKKEAWYIISTVALLVIIVLLVSWENAPWAEHFRRPRRGGPPLGGAKPNAALRYIGMAMPYFTALLGSALFEVARYANRKEREAAELRGEKLEAELKFLRSQINPHFLFNALNNIYALMVMRSERAPEMLLKLSGMLRYMLHDCKENQVPLRKEIEYLHHFIELHRLKDSRGLNIQVALDDSRPHLLIAPLLLVPFVENAFKHSKIEDREKGWVSIRLSTGDDHIVFEVENSLPEGSHAKNEVGGIGLNNVRRQLELLYPDRHTLEIRNEGDRFYVRLHLSLNSQTTLTSLTL